MSRTATERIAANDRIVVVVNGPYSLLQALWYYSVYPEGKWDAIVIKFRTEELAQETIKVCKRTGIFENVHYASDSLLDASITRKVVMFIKMGASWLSGNKKRWCRNWIKRITGTTNYTKAIIPSDFNIVGGCFINLLNSGNIICLEDGLVDYLERECSPKFNAFGIVGWFLSKMGYMTLYKDYAGKLPFKGTQKCIKYVNIPNLMKYRDYLEIRQLFEHINDDLFREVAGRAFPIIGGTDISEFDVILFTCPIDDFFDDEALFERIHGWLKDNYGDKKILVKKHPRDIFAYSWNDLEIEVGYNSIPGELFIANASNKKFVLMYASTLLIPLIGADCDYLIIKYHNTGNKTYEKTVQDVIELLNISADYIVKI